MKLLRGLVVVKACLYPVVLLGIALALRWVGERWWPTAAGLYMPRIVLAAPLPVFALALAALKLKRFLWTQVVAALVLLFPLMGLVVSGPASRKADAPVVRVLSYNIDSGSMGLDGVVEQIRLFSPDIVLLQEIALQDELVQRLGQRYSTVRATGQFAMATNYHVASETDPDKVVFGGRPRSPRFTQYIIETPLGPIAFYNVHPISPRAGFYALRGGGLRRKILSGHWLTSFDSSVFRAETGLREAQVREFASEARLETLPVVIAGDTNLPGLSRVLGENLSSYKDGFSSVGRGFGYTFPTGREWMRIDRIFASDRLRFVGLEVGRSDASDHRCVVADLQTR
jgi:endonuclease/exonuclease/phosphatase (EEP) superfamily protein YafD